MSIFFVWSGVSWLVHKVCVQILFKSCIFSFSVVKPELFYIPCLARYFFMKNSGVTDLGYACQARYRRISMPCAAR